MLRGMHIVYKSLWNGHQIKRDKTRKLTVFTKLVKIFLLFVRLLLVNYTN